MAIQLLDTNSGLHLPHVFVRLTVICLTILHTSCQTLGEQNEAKILYIKLLLIKKPNILVSLPLKVIFYKSETMRMTRVVILHHNGLHTHSVWPHSTLLPLTMHIQTIAKPAGRL